MNQFAEHILLAVDKDKLAESNGGSRENHSATIKIRNWRDAIRGYAKFDQTHLIKKNFYINTFYIKTFYLDMAKGGGQPKPPINEKIGKTSLRRF